MLADEVFDVANLGAGALVFGQLLGDRFSTPLALFGFGAWVALAGFTLRLMQENGR